MNDDTSISRRNAMVAMSTTLAAVWTAAVAGLSAVFVTAPLRMFSRRRNVDLGVPTDFNSTFRAVDLRVPMNDGWHSREDNVRVYARLDEAGKLLVLSAVCTHLGCMVKWDASAGEFQCPCHGGRYRADGSVLDGPPPEPLRRLRAEIREGRVTADLS